MAGERLAKLINDAKTPEREIADMIYGRVTATNPLTIRIDNGYEINANDYTLDLSKMVQNLTVTINVPTVTATVGQINNVALNGNRPNVDVDVTRTQVVTGINTGTQPQQVQIFRALQTGDRVKILRCGKGQRFYILERE